MWSMSGWLNNRKLYALERGVRDAQKRRDKLINTYLCMSRDNVPFAQRRATLREALSAIQGYEAAVKLRDQELNERKMHTA